VSSCAAVPIEATGARGCSILVTYVKLYDTGLLAYVFSASHVYVALPEIAEEI